MASDFRWLGRSEDGDTIVLKRFKGEFKPPEYATQEWKDRNRDLIRRGIALDVETTGLNPATDKVIEVGIRPFEFNRSRGDILSVSDGYNGLQDPEEPLSELIQRLTGLTDDKLQGQQIDWGRVSNMIEEAQLVIAHNAAFDRPFVDRFCPASKNSIWACSLKQIDWNEYGFHTSKLEFLSVYHGFYTDAHRALSDADALLYLLSLPQPQSEFPYFRDLLQNARRPMVQILASRSPFESKDALKQRNYRWDNEIRCWKTLLYKDLLEDELAWLETVVYNGEFGGSVRDIPPQENFSEGMA